MLKFTGPVLATGVQVQGKITKWNDPQLEAPNPGVNLPAAHCSSQIRWIGGRSGASKTVPWPIGVGASDSEGVTNTLDGSLNSIGYVAPEYTLTRGIPIAFVKNPMDIAPSLDSTLNTSITTLVTHIIYVHMKLNQIDII